MKATYHGIKMYRPLFISNGNAVAYPPIGFKSKDEAIQWLQNNKEFTNHQAQIIEEHVYTYEF